MRHFSRGAGIGLFRPFLRNNVNHAGNGIGAVQNGRCPLGDLYLGDIFRVDHVQVQKPELRLIIGDAIDQNERPALIEAVDRNARMVLGACCNSQAGCMRQDFSHGVTVRRLDVIGGNRGCCRHLRRGLGRVDHHLAQIIGLVIFCRFLFRSHCGAGVYKREQDAPNQYE